MMSSGSVGFGGFGARGLIWLFKTLAMREHQVQDS